MPRGIITESHTRSLRKINDRAAQIELALQGDREGWTVKEMERRVNEYLKGVGEPTKLRIASSRPPAGDPLAKYWKPILETAGHAGVKVAAVRYEGSGRWALRVETGGAADPRLALADFFIRLGQTLNAPIPSDLIDTIQ